MLALGVGSVKGRDGRGGGSAKGELGSTVTRRRRAPLQGTRKNFRSERVKRGSETRVPLLKSLTSISWLLKGLKTKPCLPGTALAVGTMWCSGARGGSGGGAGGVSSGVGVGRLATMDSAGLFQPIQVQQGVRAATATMAMPSRGWRPVFMLEKQHYEGGDARLKCCFGSI